MNEDEKRNGISNGNKELTRLVESEIQRRNSSIPAQNQSPSRLTSRDSTHFNVGDANVLHQVSDWGHFESVNFQSERAQDVSVAPDGTRTVTHRVTTKLSTTHYDEQAPIIVKAGMTEDQKEAVKAFTAFAGVAIFVLLLALIIAVANHH